MTLWFTNGEYAVCDGLGPTNVVGYIIHTQDGWIIRDDPQNRHFLDPQSAAASALNKPFPGDLLSYMIKRDGDERTVLTYPDVIELIKKDGWTVVMSERAMPK